jgi:predicted Zn-dependent protease
VHRKWDAVRQGHALRFHGAMERAASLAGADDLAAAEASLRALAADMADDPDLLNLLAMVRHRLGAPREAADLMERAVRARPDDPNLWFNGGIACAAASMPGAAKRCFERVLELEPGHALARQRLAQLGVAAR